jgi:hypothetical protein
MAFLQLQPYVSYGLVGERPIFLDLKRDRYLALDPGSEDALRGLLSAEEPTLPDSPALERLLRTGLFRQSSLRGRLAPDHSPAPARSLVGDRPSGRTRWSSPFRAWTAVSRARRRLRSVPLAGIVDALVERRADLPEGEPALAEESARAFLAARPLVPVERSCLLDSLALLDWLGDRSGHAKLVFGVRLDPFGAHCWLQTEQAILTDAADTVGNFAPVLAI